MRRAPGARLWGGAPRTLAGRPAGVPCCHRRGCRGRPRRRGGVPGDPPGGRRGHRLEAGQLQLGLDRVCAIQVCKCHPRAMRLPRLSRRFDGRLRLHRPSRLDGLLRREWLADGLLCQNRRQHLDEGWRRLSGSRRLGRRIGRRCCLNWRKDLDWLRLQLLHPPLGGLCGGLWGGLWGHRGTLRRRRHRAASNHLHDNRSNLSQTAVTHNLISHITQGLMPCKLVKKGRSQRSNYRGEVREHARCKTQRSNLLPRQSQASTSPSKAMIFTHIHKKGLQ